MTNMSLPLKRLVRQEAGFGCCKCGFPIIEYHHIVKGSSDPQDIMILCPIHHTEATKGAMLKKEQKYLKRNPYNLKKGYADGQLRINQEIPVVLIGTNHFFGDGDYLIVDEESLLSIEIYERKLELSMRLYDPEDNLVADIQRNEWIAGDPLPWDLESKFRWLRLRRSLRDIQLEVDARSFPIKIRADIWRNGVNFQLDPNDVVLNWRGGGITNISFKNSRIGNVMKVDTTKNAFDVVGRVKKERVRFKPLTREQLCCKHDFLFLIERSKYVVTKCKKCGLIEKKWKI